MSEQANNNTNGELVTGSTVTQRFLRGLGIVCFVFGGMTIMSSLGELSAVDRIESHLEAEKAVSDEATVIVEEARDRAEESRNNALIALAVGTAATAGLHVARNRAANEQLLQ